MSLGRLAVWLGVAWCTVATMGEEQVHDLSPDVMLFTEDVRHVAWSGPSMYMYRAAFWPVPNNVVGDVIPLNTLDASVVEDAVSAVRHVVRPHLVPKDLGTRFVARRVRQDSIPPSIADVLLARYQMGEWRIQLHEAMSFVSLVVQPTRPFAQMPPEQYVRRIAREVLRIPEAVAGEMVVSTSLIGTPPDGRLRSIVAPTGRTIWFGVLRYEGRAEAWHSRSPNRPKDAWLGQMRTMTDGCSVYFVVRETHRKPRPPQVRPGPVPRFPQPRASSTRPARPRPSPAQRRSQPVRRGWEAYLQATSKPAKK